MPLDELTPPLYQLITSADAASPLAARFDVRSFVVSEALSTLFQIKVTAHHPEAAVDFEEIVGAPAAFSITGHGAAGLPHTRAWTGVVSHMEQTRAVGGPRSYSTYELTLVPRLWL